MSETIVKIVESFHWFPGPEFQYKHISADFFKYLAVYQSRKHITRSFVYRYGIKNDQNNGPSMPRIDCFIMLLNTAL